MNEKYLTIGLGALVAVLAITTAVKSPKVSLVMPDGFTSAIEDAFQRVADGAKQLGSAGNEYGERVNFQDGAAFNGAVQRGNGKRFSIGTTTPVSLRCPTRATSTVLSIFANIFKNATTTPRTMYISTSTVPAATSSTAIVAQRDVVANEDFSLTASTTNLNGTSKAMVCSPGDYIVLNFKGGNQQFGVGTTSELDGYFSATFLTEGQ